MWILRALGERGEFALSLIKNLPVGQSWGMKKLSGPKEAQNLLIHSCEHLQMIPLHLDMLTLPFSRKLF